MVRSLVFSSLCFVFVGAGVADNGRSEEERRVIPQGQGGYAIWIRDLTVRPDALAGKASVPVVERGLEVTLQPARREFPSTGILEFWVTFRNRLDRRFRLNELTGRHVDLRLVISNQKTAAQWTIERIMRVKPTKPIVLGPGAKYAVKLVVARSPHVLRRLEPEFRPNDQPPVKLPGAVRPALIPRPVRPPLPIGTGKCRAMLLIEFRKTKSDAKPNEWVGKVASMPVDFAVVHPNTTILEPRRRDSR